MVKRMRLRVPIAEVLVLILTYLAGYTHANPHAKKLYNDLLIRNGYNKLIRPVANHTDVLNVKIGMKLSQLIGVNADVSGKKKSTSFDCGPEKLCRCYNFTLRMACRIRGFTTFDVDRAKNWSWVEHLDLEQNYLQSVPDLSMFTNLKILILAENPHISTLEENSFEGLENLESLDMTRLNMSFENGTIHEQTLKPLRKLRILRIKQEGPISAQDDYSFLLPVKDTIEQLFMVANSNLREVLDESFPRLRILSLGGKYCNLTGFATNGFTNIQKLPLTKLSLRNCNISSVPVDFFRPLARSLERLDISCNPIHEGLLNITQGLMGGKLTVLVADYINHKAIPCYWNMTSEYILQTLEVVSLRANHINYFVRAGNGSEFMKALKYFDISRNPLNGAAFDIFTFKCTDWFWCDQTIPHQLQFFGINGITHTGSQTCGDTPVDFDFSCPNDSKLLLSDKTPLFEHVRHPEYLDDVILKKFFEETNATILTDATTYINSSFNMSSLPSKSILRFLIESMLQHPKSGFTISDVINMIVRAGSSTKSFRALTAYFCTEHAMKVIYEDSMKKWASFQKTSSYAWTDRQTHFTINYICKPEWQYGVSFLADERFHFIYTNLTTVQALRNDLEILSVPNQYCNNAVYFLNNLRSIDLSLSYVPYIACSNITGLDSIYRIKCRRCNNNGWDFNGEDLPGLTELAWQENNIGKLVQEGNIFKGFKHLAWIDLIKQSPPINHFKRNDTFSDQQLTLSVLILDECGIEIWNTSLANHVSLTRVSLRDNVIRFIDEEYRQDLEQVYNKVHSSSPFQVYLEGNPINCSCNPDNLKFINWLNSAKVIYDKAKVKCADMTLVSSFPKKCRISEGGWPTWKTIAVSSTAAVVVLMVIFILMGRQIRRNRRAGYERLQMDNLPTVFISFTPRMMEDVNALKTMTQDRLILLSSSWDFSDGGVISGNLSRIIAHTQKFILVVSEDYFTESNTSTEFNLLKQAGLLNRETVVLILTSSNIIRNQLPTVLQEMFNDGNFLVWPTGLCSCASVELQEICQKIIKKILP